MGVDELTEQEREAIYDILVEWCGASEDLRGECLVYLAQPVKHGGHEFRFGGSLGSGGKLYSNSQGVYVDCYWEHKSPIAAFAIKVANTRIRAALASSEAQPQGDALGILRDLVEAHDGWSVNCYPGDGSSRHHAEAWFAEAEAVEEVVERARALVEGSAGLSVPSPAEVVEAAAKAVDPFLADYVHRKRAAKEAAEAVLAAARAATQEEQHGH